MVAMFITSTLLCPTWDKFFFCFFKKWLCYPDKMVSLVLLSDSFPFSWKNAAWHAALSALFHISYLETKTVEIRKNVWWLSKLQKLITKLHSISFLLPFYSSSTPKKYVTLKTIFLAHPINKLPLKEGEISHSIERKFVALQSQPLATEIWGDTLA